MINWLIALFMLFFGLGMHKDVLVITSGLYMIAASIGVGLSSLAKNSDKKDE